MNEIKSGTGGVPSCSNSQSTSSKSQSTYIPYHLTDIEEFLTEVGQRRNYLRKTDTLQILRFIKDIVYRLEKLESK